MSFNESKAKRNAEKCLTQGNINGAIKEYRQIVDNNPRDYNTLNILGDLYRKAKDDKNAVECYNKVAQHYQKQGFAKKAIAMFNKIYKIVPESVDISQKLAELYHLRGSFAEAREHYQKLADHYEEVGNKDDALSTWEKIGELDPNNTEIFLKIAEQYWGENREHDAAEAFSKAGERLAKAGKHESAVTAFSRALEILPSDQRAIEGFVTAQLTLGYPEEAISALKKKVENDPFDNDANMLLVDCYYETGEPEKAEEIVVRMVEREPTKYPKLQKLIEVYLNQDDLDSACRIISMVSEHMLVGGTHEELLSYLEEVLARNPEHIEALRVMIRYHSWLKEDEEVISALERLADVARLNEAVDDERFALGELIRLVPHEGRFMARFKEIEANSPAGAYNPPSDSVPDYGSYESLSTDEDHNEAENSGEYQFESFNDEPVVEASVVEEVEEVSPVDSVDQHMDPNGAVSPVDAVDQNLDPSSELSPVEAINASIDETDMSSPVDAIGASVEDPVADMESAAGAFEHSETETKANEFESVSETETSEQITEEVSEPEAAQTDSENEIVETEEAVHSGAPDEDVFGEISYEDRVRLDEEIESIRFYIEQGYEGLADKSLGELEIEFGNLPELVELRDQVGGLSASSGDIASAEAPATQEDTESAKDSFGGVELSGKDPGSLANEIVGDTISDSESIGEEETSGIAQTEQASVETLEEPTPEESGFDFTPAEVPESETQEAVTESEEAESVEVETAEADVEAVAETDVESEVTEMEKSEEAECSEAAETVESAETEEVPESHDDAEVVSEEPVEDEEIDFNASFANFQSELGFETEEEESTDDDFDNHYHHAIAYKEMGLVEDAIREFQDAVNSIAPDDGTKRYLNCCTLIGDCFLEKGMPNLSVIWFQKGS